MGPRDAVPRLGPRTQELFARPLAPREEAALYAEWRELALALGVPGHHVPADPAAFRAYFAAMVADRLEDNATVRLILELDRHPMPPPPTWTRPRVLWLAAAAPTAVVLRRASIAALPPELRTRFGLPFTPVQAARFAAFAHGLKALDRTLPDRLRRFPVRQKDTIV